MNDICIVQIASTDEGYELYKDFDSVFIRHVGELDGYDVYIDYFAISAKEFTRKQGLTLLLNKLKSAKLTDIDMQYVKQEELLKCIEDTRDELTQEINNY